MAAFYLEDYERKAANRTVPVMSFAKLCEAIKDDFIKEWDRDGEDAQATLELQKKAIIGYAKEVAFFKEKINARLKE